MTEESLHVGWLGQKETNWIGFGLYVVFPAMFRRERRVSRGQRGGVGRRIYYLCLCVTGRVRFDGNAKADWALV